MESAESSCPVRDENDHRVCWKRLTVWSCAIFAAAVALRMPSCYESFWVDELHSAWTVWGSLGDVFHRSDIGHQSPIYFLGLWLWKAVVGESELALRLSSVLAVSAACGLLTFGIGRWTNNLLAGLASGAILAIESNSLFFGTELRPYAFVILFSSIACLFYLRILDTRSRGEDSVGWCGLIVAVVLAAICQPTSAGVLAWLPLTLFAIWFVRDRKQLLRVSMLDGVVLISLSAIGFALWRITLGESWQQRDNWASFATAQNINQLWQAWNWRWLAIIPAGLLVVSLVVHRVRRPDTKERRRPIYLATCLMLLVSFVATLLFWAVSVMEWVPIWHRRFFVAVLPMFAIIAGGVVAAYGQQVAKPNRRGAISLAIGTLLVVGLGVSQKTFQRLDRYPVALVRRSEDWRGAVEWINRNIEGNNLVYIDSGLIESQQLLGGVVIVRSELPAEQREYLSYPVLGPYQLADCRVSPVFYGYLNHPTRRAFMLIRRPVNRRQLPLGTGIYEFGGVKVLAFPSRLDMVR